MTNDQKLELIRTYIDNIKEYIEERNLSVNDRQHLERALETYSSLYRDAETGKIDLDFLHENISSYLYVIE